MAGPWNGECGAEPEDISSRLVPQPLALCDHRQALNLSGAQGFVCTTQVKKKNLSVQIPKLNKSESHLNHI